MAGGGEPRLGIDVGGTTLRVGVVVGTGVVWEHRHTAHFSRNVRPDRPKESLEYVLDAVAAATRPALGRHPGVRGVGLAVPGFITLEGRLTRSPNLPGLTDVDLAGPLRERLGVPVVVENDALAAAWGEHVLHPDRPPGLIYVGLGTGVGGGLVLGGRPYRGAHGFAMEVGHLVVERDGRLCGCGNRGCLEQYASATGVRTTFREATGRALEAHEIAAAARDGEPAGREAFERAGLALGSVIAHLVKALDVSEVVVGGGLSASWDLLEPYATRRLEHDLLPVLRGRTRIRVSTSGDQAGMIGAALLTAAEEERA